MLSAGEILEALVAKLRAIPDLLVEMDGDAARIYPYHDAYPTHVSLRSAVYEAPHPSILVAWQRTGPGTFGQHVCWQHDFVLYLRAREAPPGPTSGYYKLAESIVNGVPMGESVRLLNADIHTSCYPMDVPRIERVTDEEGVDHFVANLSLREIGDA
jgi:hypothetical protein